MKILVLHPRDESTDFLVSSYRDAVKKDGDCWTVIRSTDISKKRLKEAIKRHDVIIMMGHGSEHGLFAGENRMLIDSTLVYLLREKLCCGIWCNADEFFKKYQLRGLFTGMIISEDLEANLYCVNCTLEEIEESNSRFAFALSKSFKYFYQIDNELLRDMVNAYYRSEVNPVIMFNESKVYYAD